MSPELINKITNILGVVVLLGGVLLNAISAVPEGSSLFVYLGSVLSAVILFFMGRSAVSLKKQNPDLK